MDLDALDRRLVAQLQSDARQSLRKLARTLGVSTPTVAARLERLEQSGVIQGYHARLSPQWAQIQVAIVECTPSQTAEFAEVLTGLNGVEQVLQLAGGPLLVYIRNAPQTTLAGLHATAARTGATYRTHPIAAAWEPVTLAPPETVATSCHYCNGAIQGEPSRAVLGGRPHVFCCNQCRAAFVARFEGAQSKASQLPIVKPRVVK